MGNLTIFTMNYGGDTMKEPLDLSKYSVRTDLAVEHIKCCKSVKKQQQGIQGVIVKEKEEGIIITKVTIDEVASESMGKNLEII